VTERSGRRRPLLALVLLAGAVTACSIQPDASPREIPPADRALSDPATPAEGGAASGSSRVFLVTKNDDGEPRLRSVLRSAELSVSAVISELLMGPNAQDEASGITTALPRGLVMRSARSSGGVATVDVSSQLLDEPAPQLIVAIAQIVFTASELEGVREVRILVEDKSRPWPDSEGELHTAPLTVYDFPDLVESSQPAYPPIPSPPPAS
jgi:spore germination protein GerM